MSWDQLFRLDIENSISHTLLKGTAAIQYKRITAMWKLTQCKQPQQPNSQQKAKPRL